MHITIRQYKTSDLEAVLDSWEDATRLAHRFMTDEFIAKERTNVATVYIPNTDTWVAEIDGDVKGFVALMGDEIGAIFLQPNWHGLRIGKLLMDKAKELHGNLFVEVFKENKIGRNFYLKCGFQCVEEKYHQPTEQILYRLSYSVS